MQNLGRNFDSGKRILNRFFNVCRSHNVQGIGSKMNTRIQINVMVEKMRKPRGSRGSVGLKIYDENINLWVFLLYHNLILEPRIQNLEIQNKYVVISYSLSTTNLDRTLAHFLLTFMRNSILVASEILHCAFCIDLKTDYEFLIPELKIVANFCLTSLHDRL